MLIIKIELAMTCFSAIESRYYPYHLTWEELNNPGDVLQEFLKKWDLQYCRVLLRKWQNKIASNQFETNPAEYTEMKTFINEFEKLLEAVYIIRLQFDEAQAAARK